MTLTKHFVEFLSPGTFISEESIVEISSWDEEKATAIAMAKDIKERHGATPYGFRFITKERGNDDLDSKEVKHSGIYYLGGKVETLAELKAKGDADDKTLIANMECNGWDKIITTDTSIKWTAVFAGSDKVLDW